MKAIELMCHLQAADASRCGRHDHHWLAKLRADLHVSPIATIKL